MAAERIKEQFLGKWVEVELTDGRLIYGQLAATDKDANYILAKADERWEKTDKERRYIGTVMATRTNTKKIILAEERKPRGVTADPCDSETDDL